MRRRVTILLPTALLAAATLAQADLTETTTIENSLAVDDGELVVIVDNVFGSIRVTGHDRSSVELTAVETIRGDLQSDLDRARAENELRTEQEPGRVAFRVRRIGDNGQCDCNWRRWDDYVLKYDIELRVPRDAAIDLSTVNEGEILVDGVRGAFDVSNVNGEVRMTGLRGAGSVHTVNGKIETRFEQAPAAATSFKTVNGRIEAKFPDNLAADFDLKTMHGEIFTDFEVEPLVRDAETERSRDGGSLVIRSRRSNSVRVASGGPTYSFETLNGDILIRKVER
jgi:hypothetical protein